MVTLKKIVQTLSKCATYPTIGNLTHKLNEGFKNKVGTDWYDPEVAHSISYFTNCFTNPFLIYTGARVLGIDNVIAGQLSSLSALYTVSIELTVRYGLRLKKNKLVASCAGKVISMPLEKIL